MNYRLFKWIFMVIFFRYFCRYFFGFRGTVGRTCRGNWRGTLGERLGKTLTNTFISYTFQKQLLVSLNDQELCDRSGGVGWGTGLLPAVRGLMDLLHNPPHLFIYSFIHSSIHSPIELRSFIRNSVTGQVVKVEVQASFQRSGDSWIHFVPLLSQLAGSYIYVQ